MMKILLEQDLAPALWMLEHQINDANDLVRFWKVFRSRVRDCPTIEKYSPNWFSGLF